MAGYNFLDPAQEQEYLQKATAQGFSIGEAKAYANNKKREQLQSNQLGLDLTKQTVEGLKAQKDILQLTGQIPEEESQSIKDKQRFADLAIGTVDQMQNIYFRKGDNLAEGHGITGKIGLGLESLGEAITGSSDNKSQYREFEQVANILVSQLSQAFGSGTPQEGEAQRLIQSMPSRTSTPEEAEAWFRNVKQLLSGAAGHTQQPQAGTPTPGLGLGTEQTVDAPPGTQPALNLKGEIAKYGDVIYNESKGQLETYGEPSEEDVVFKRTQEGSDIDNSFIKFLADSEFLPIAGSIAGGLMGAGVGSIATGAAGAVAGKALQQGIRELMDPEQQEMSDMAKAVLVEGATDAIMGGMFFGVGAVAGKGIKIVMSNMPGMTKIAGEAVEEGAEAGVKSSNAAKSMIKKGLWG